MARLDSFRIHLLLGLAVTLYTPAGAQQFHFAHNCSAAVATESRVSVFKELESRRGEAEVLARAKGRQCCYYCYL